MAFTAADVKNLREATGVGMMDCKKALAASDGDMDKAIEWLREKGLAAAQKKAGRIAAEGMAYAWVCEDCGVGSIVEVNAESDFVAKNDLFVDYVQNVAKVVAKENPADLDALFACKYPGSDKTVLDEQNDKVLVIGENIKVRRFGRYDTGVSIPYVHMGGRIAVLMNLTVGEGFEKNEKVVELGKDLAMQVAALNPQFLDKSQVSEEFIANEKRVRLLQAKEDPKNAKKPDAIIEKIVMGGLNKYFSEICLLQQPFVKDDKVSVEQHVANVAKELGTTITVNGYIRFEKGEGIEKRQDDLAEEVAKLIK
ncbi:MAG TPA: elongation factor Ts [Candidatus Scatomorpha pullicola]|nr:elongation factor Ts [Candidatus Scatomorpha pullicola]